MSRHWTHSIAILISLLFWTAGAVGDDAPLWSPKSNGLQAQLVMRRSHKSNGTCIIVTYVTLKNVSNSATPLLIKVDPDHMIFRVTDDGGEELPMINGPFSGMQLAPPELVLPHDSTIRFRMGPRGWGIPGDQAALVDLGSTFGWAIPHNKKCYKLQAVLEIAKKNGSRSEKGDHWHGRLELPAVRIPTKPKPVNHAVLGARINDLGAKMLGADSDASEAAVRELSA